MVADRRRPRNATLREWIDQGARCPFCGSLRLDVDPTFETPESETQSPESQITYNEPYNFMRVDCVNCGYVLFFEPSKFGSPGR
jgi:hypothetical protein